MKRLLCIIMSAVISLLSSVGFFTLFYKSPGGDYSVMQIDLCREPDGGVPENLKYLYELVCVDDTADYLAHPDSVVLKNGDIACFYPQGHGKGAIKTKISSDGGRSYASEIQNTPKSWENSRETPTVYRLEFSQSDTEDKLILISANPKWQGEPTRGGFNCSVSCDEGVTWSEFQLFYPFGSNGGVIPIVAMSSLTRLKENGVFVDKWMGLFHDGAFNNYKTILTFDADGNPCWSKPEKYFIDYKWIQYGTQMCETEVIRSDNGKGDELCLITRSNSKKYNSLVSFSSDEGKTWSEPKEVNPVLNGERHKAEYTKDGRLVITFRSIERSREKIKKYLGETSDESYFSEGPIAWVGTYDDIKNGSSGQYRIKLAHTYLKDQTQPDVIANGDTGYCGNCVLDDDTVVISTYGCFNPQNLTSDGSGYKTYIASKRFKLSDIDRLAEFLNK